MLKKSKLIAVSGGVDSMFLLNQHKNDNIIVAYVNYNIRNDTYIDQKIISNFCSINNLKIEILSLNEKYTGNFQEWARNKRFDFFKTIYEKYQCKELIIAQHKDDFLESAIMQWRFKRNPYSFGINKKNKIFGMKILRPIIFEYWKYQIYEFSKELNIPFNEDYTNFTNKYTRNKIRDEFSKTPLIIKEILFKSFQIINVEKSIHKINIIKKYFQWSKTSFNINFLMNNKFFADDLIFKYLIEKFNDNQVKISFNIIKSIYIFLTSNNGNKFFLLSNNQKISKINNNVIII